jgi:hypothetical protein
MLAFNTRRVPVEVIDLNVQTGQILKVVKVKESTAWENVPTPTI